MTHILFEGARIIDPSQGMDETGSLIVAGNKILASGKNVLNQGFPEKAERINCQGKVILPGLVDSGVYLLAGNDLGDLPHLLESISQEAGASGITSMVFAPDINPLMDNVAALEYFHAASQKKAQVNIYAMAAITTGLGGERLAPFGALKKAGAVAFSQGRQSISNSLVMRTALMHIRDLDSLLWHQPLDRQLASNGVIHEGFQATRLGLPAIPSEAETIPLQRDLLLAQRIGGRYHGAKISSALSVCAIRRAKEDGASVSASVSINSLCLNEKDIGEYDTRFRLSPPLRAREDQQALVEGLGSSILDMIVSSHEPVKRHSKQKPFENAEAGSAGLKNFFPAALHLHHHYGFSLTRLVHAISTFPAQLFGLPAGTLKSGSAADFIIADTHMPWTQGPEKEECVAEKTCFDGIALRGRVLETWVAGCRIFNHN